ncbi:hypothetical protein MIR68_010830 [Amoeboaphelidium protococcarum]|nr:hypothetical protein MIR68_010830 [Amoeboaphelidium protococcarum]KAI3642161.1 hypothetical protein MP228_011716 [Amoeboaphelidium protococcarum]
MASTVTTSHPQSYIGFDTLVKQIEKKIVSRGFHFNIMLVGQSGLGKSTFVNSLFNTHLVDPAVGGVLQQNPSNLDAVPGSGDVGRQRASSYSTYANLNPSKGPTTDIRCSSFQVHDQKLRMKLNVIDTPGFGSSLNNEHCWEPLCRYIKDQYAVYLRKELSPSRDVKKVVDTRVHCVLYFIFPSGHSLRPIDITVMKKLSEISNVVPVIAKSDALTVQERADFKKRIAEEIKFHQINVFPSSHFDDDEDPEEQSQNAAVRDILPFCVSSSEHLSSMNGQNVRTRFTRYGAIINTEDPLHSDFTILKNFLIKTHMQSLIEVTSVHHYEQFRTRQLVALKEATKTQQQQQQQPGAQQQ